MSCLREMQQWADWLGWVWSPVGGGHGQRSGKDRDEVTFLGFLRSRREGEFWTEMERTRTTQKCR